MDRRNFVKLVGTASGGAVTGACGKKSEQIIPLLVSEEEIEPGVEQWHPSVCGDCGAGCGTTARVMAAEREIEVDGERFRQQVAAIKKLEGNPADPVSGGRLCARGHAALQSLYSPDRLRGPMKRVGQRGEGRFEPISWERALEEVSESLARSAASDPGKILYLTRPQASSRSATAARFLESLGAPPARSVGTGDFAAEIEASRRAFGWAGIPVYEIQDSTLVLSIGADFLGGWVSPVLYARRYGHMRQGRAELRGRLIHAESRFSLTAWNANRWLPVWPGQELALALGIGHVLVSEHPAPNVAEVPDEVLATFESVDLPRVSEACGISIEAMRETAAALAQASAPVVVAGASMVRENSADAVTAACALNVLLGRVGESGGVMPPAASGTGLEDSRPDAQGWEARLAEAEIVFVDGVNPAYNAPSAASALTEAGTVVSFSPFVDDTAAYADLILPDHDALEKGRALVPDVSPVPAVSTVESFVSPLYDTRSTEDVLVAVAEAVGKPIEAMDPAGVLGGLHQQMGSASTEQAAFVREQLRQGGWRGERTGPQGAGHAALGSFREAGKRGGLQFQAYASVQFGEGAGANRPWLQEMPDPGSSAMWGTAVEVDPGTAAGLGVTNGSMVRVESASGSLEAPAYVHPAAIPGVVSMALGLGHANYGRYASGRGANPMAVVGDSREAATGAIVHGPVEVTLSMSGSRGRLIQFSRQDRDEAPHRV